MAESRRNIATLVPAGITFLAFGALLLIARFWQHIPVKPPGCSFRNITGIPCIGCGGTRCMIALSHGEIVKSFLFNPAVFIGILVVVAWFAISLRRYFLKITPAPLTQSQLALRGAFLKIALPILVFLNWIYLAIYLPAA